ncbi:MAG: hypothetical protein WC027_01675 [Candidatus Paceibacterota bacterium]
MTVLLENEKSIAEVRKHPFYFYTQSLGLMILMIAPFFIFRIFSLIINWTYLTAEVVSFLIFAYTMFLSVIWILLFISWTDYFVDVWIITDTRIIDFELKGLYHKDVASVRLEDIEDVKVVVTGIIESWLKIGNLYIQTAGMEREFVIKGVCEPDKMKLAIMKAVEAHHQSKN